MAQSENLPAETTGELDIPPDNAETNKKPKEASWRTTPEENKQETTEIPTWPLNQPFSSTLPDKPRSILRQGVLRVKREKRFLINNDNNNNNNNNKQSQTQQMLLMMQQQITEQRRIQSEEKLERLEQQRIQKVESLEQQRIQKVERLEQQSIQNKTSTRIGKMLQAFTLQMTTPKTVPAQLKHSTEQPTPARKKKKTSAIQKLEAGALPELAPPNDLPRNAIGVEFELPSAPSFVPPSFELPPDHLQPKFQFDLSPPKASEAKSFVPPSFELPPDHLWPKFQFDMSTPEASKAKSALRHFTVLGAFELPPKNLLRNELGVEIEPPLAPSFAPPPFKLPPEHARALAMLTLGGLLLKEPFRVLNGFLSFPTPPPDFTRKQKQPPDPPKSTAHRPEEIDSENLATG
jgi:hypothetical protein